MPTTPHDPAARDGEVDPDAAVLVDPDEVTRWTADDALVIDGSGLEPISVVPWAVLIRERVRTRAQQSDRYPTIVLWTVLYGLFSVGFTITILSFSLTHIARDLDTREVVLTWVITGPILAFAVVGPTMGKLADLYGPRRVYLLGLAGSAFFAGLTAVAWDAGSLIGFRVVGAAIGAAAGPASLSMINRMFPPERRAQAMGYWSLVAAGGPVLGVVAGGPIVEVFGWRWIFAAQAPLMFAGVLIAFALLPEVPRRRDVSFDVPGAVLLAGAATTGLVALNRGPAWGWTHPAVLAFFAAAPVLLSAFVVVERRAAAPMVPLAYFSRRNFVFPITAQVFGNFAYMGGFLLTPQLLEKVLDIGTQQGSQLSIARPLSFAVAGPVAGWLTIRIGERVIGVFGMACISLSMVILATVEPTSSPMLVVVSLLLSGIGMGAASPAMAAAIANAVADHDLGIAGAAQQMMSQIGVVAGTQVMFTVYEARTATVGLVSAFHEAYLFGAAACALATIASAFVHRTPERAC
jgi:EmrB/QacA subfamily drug resistance transporter